MAMSSASRSGCQKGVTRTAWPKRTRGALALARSSALLRLRRLRLRFNRVYDEHVKRELRDRFGDDVTR